MNKTIISLWAMIFLAGLSVSAQYVQQYGNCPQTNLSPIQCGYYQEGYQDGANDAQTNQENNYKRHRNKLDGDKYENFYRQGYDAGYAAVRPYQRWDKDQKENYDDGFQDGENDKRRNISRLPERYEGQFDKSYEAFYKQGYYDGYDGKSRQYDTPLGGVQPNYPNYPNYPTNPTYPNYPSYQQGTATGTVYWSGKVDDRVNVVIQGSEVRTQIVGGTSGYATQQTMNGVLPRRPATISVNKTDGRGNATVIQQPNRDNGYTAIVQIFDSKRGTDDYSLQINWQSTAPVEEPYRSGRVTWRGKVDQTANIIIAGSSVQTQDASATGLSGVTHNISGYLARRPGSVSVKKNKGRGTVTVYQQPTAENDFVAIIQVFDADKGGGDYEVEISW
jgi:hypothetical protein